MISYTYESSRAGNHYRKGEKDAVKAVGDIQLSQDVKLVKGEKEHQQPRNGSHDGAPP